MNKAILIGRLTKDPELRTTPTGRNVCQFSVAVSRNFTNANGEREADFINCVVWDKQAENLESDYTFTPITKEKIQQTESRLGFEFPKSYKIFLEKL